MKNIVCTLFIIISFFAKAQVVGTPYLPFASTDMTRLALAAVGCTSCAAYDAATDTALVPITLAEYNSILANVSGAVTRGIDNFSSTANIGIYNSLVVAASTNFTLIPQYSYIAAVAIQTNTSTGKFKITTSSSTSTIPICLTGESTALSSTSGTIYYFAVKKPTTNSGTFTSLGRTSSTGIVYTYQKTAPANSQYYYQVSGYVCGNTISSMTGYPSVPAFQVIATTTRPW